MGALESIGRKIKRVIDREDVLDLLAEGDWGQGGCWILAEALARWFGPPAQLYAVMGGDRPGVQHVVVKLWDDLFIDRDGVQTAERLLAHAQEDGIERPRISRFTKTLQRRARAGGIPCDYGVVSRLHSLLEREVGGWGP